MATIDQSTEVEPQTSDPVLQFDDTRVRQKAAPVAEEDFGSPKLSDWIAQLERARKALEGIGIAGPQIGLGYRVVVINIPAYERVGFGKVDAVPFHALINPTLIWLSDEKIKAGEGCLSAQGYEGFVTRPRRVKVNAFTPEGKELEIHADGLYARCLQHEIDHLDGILYVDRVATLRDIRKIEPVEAGDPVLEHNRALRKPRVEQPKAAE